MSHSKLNNFAKLHAYEFLNESEEAVQNGIAEIRQFIQNCSELDDQSICDESIVYFLRASKFVIEKTKKKIKSFYTHRLDVTEWYEYRDPYLTEISALIDIGVFLPIKQKDELNRQIVILRIAAHDPSKHLQNNVMKLSMMILDYLTMHDQTISIYGIRAIFDMTGVKLAHALQMTPKIIKNAVNAMECYPLRIQKLEFVNANRGINVILDIFRSFMTQKLRDRITVTRDIPKFNANDHLPIELGGNTGCYRDLSKHWKKVLQKNHQWFSKSL